MIELDERWFGHCLPLRARDTNKNDYGRVLAVCGAEGYTGAAYFAAQAAVRTGSGIVTLCVPRAIYPILAIKLNEPVIVPYDAGDDLTERAARADAVLIGCGLGQAEGTRERVLSLLRAARRPVVLDADGINLLAGHTDELRRATVPVILTPHGGELARLTGLVRPTAEDAAAFARDTGAIVLFKGYHSVICTPEGERFRVMAGNPGMAKGGSGDVLAGCILSLLGQGLAPAEAACAGAYLHARAGDLCAAELGEYGMTPTDLLDYLPQVLRRFDVP